MDSRSRLGVKTRRLVIAVCATSVATAVVMSFHSVVRAQQSSPLAYPLRWSADKAERIVEAMNAGLPYVPGEVLVKFKTGMGPSEQSRALQSLRSRPL